MMSEDLPILRSPALHGGVARYLTKTEVKDLRSRGVSCSEAWMVIRYVSDIPDIGRLYRPAPGGGYNNAKIRATRSSNYRVKPKLESRWQDEAIIAQNEINDQLEKEWWDEHAEEVQHQEDMRVLAENREHFEAIEREHERMMRGELV